MNTGNPLSPPSRYSPRHVDEAEEQLAQEVPDTGIFSAYHRETIFRGTNLESPVPTLELRIQGFETPLPSGIPSASEKRVRSDPVSPTDSDPFSDYLSYESEQVDPPENEDVDVDSHTSDQETPRGFDNDTLLPSQQQPKPRIITDVYPPQSQQAPRKQIPTRSPLDALCHSMQTPSDLPTSPSPFSPQPPRINPVVSQPQHYLPTQVQQRLTAAYTGTDFARQGWEPSGIPIINRPRSSSAVMPNYSLPSFKPRAENSQEKTGANGPALEGWERWKDRYRRAAPLLSCTLAIALAIGLTVCGRGSKTGISRIAKIPSSAFVDLGNGVTQVEMYPSGVCLVDGGNR
ncbi:hypothetical protein QFC24_000458 [Naganishia onofrii]|uniref:Uncharacterized protein n=1 Tax=Naganishia onofrii TaxID=1851511 RepID=A0ACC2XWX9_9TREE|nr:hypothetical protein QFC24_000458 [Naganishia onofrii]